MGEFMGGVSRRKRQAAAAKGLGASARARRVYHGPVQSAPKAIDVKKDRGVTLEWPDGTTSYYSVVYLRRMSPSADMKQLRDEMASNPLTVLPASAAETRPLVIEEAELRGNYAIWFRFSDGHATGIYSWAYLRQIDPQAPKAAEGEGPRE